ncbi:MAG: type II toxin-antitoxin system VapB family antitoxin [Geminicoccaceae bacterium]
MPLYIRDDRVKELAREVAALQASTVTDAVRVSLERRLRELRDAAAERRHYTDELLARFDAGPDRASGFTDKGLHDANGDPAG